MNDITGIMNETRSIQGHNRGRSLMERGASGGNFAGQLHETIAAAGRSDRAYDRTVPADRRLMDTCVEMESIFVGRMLKEMRNTLNREDRLIHGGQAEEIFTDMLYDQYALQLSRTSNLGLARQLYNELSRRL